MAEVYLVFLVFFVLRTCADRVRAHAADSDLFPVCSFLVLLLLNHGYGTHGSSQHAVRSQRRVLPTHRSCIGVVSHQQERFLQYLQESALRYVRKAIRQYKRRAAVTKSPSCFFQGAGKGDVTSLHGIHCVGGLEVCMSTFRRNPAPHLCLVARVCVALW